MKTICSCHDIAEILLKLVKKIVRATI